MKICNILLTGLLLISGSAIAQIDMYIGPNSSMVLATNGSMTIGGNLINDAIATEQVLSTPGPKGLNHMGGGSVYLLRHTSGGGASEVLDGPRVSLPATTENYNVGGSCVRIYDLFTDNTSGQPISSGTPVNAAVGTGQINFNQEVRVSNTMNMVNGIIWTPRNQWRHAYLHLEDTSVQLIGMAASNTQFNEAIPSSNIHVDGYVAYTGSGNFTFPVGDGKYARYCEIVDAEEGIYRAAYFKTDPKSLSNQSGISGSSVQGSIDSLAPSLESVSNNEFWDIDGSGLTKIKLHAFNSVSGYSDWGLDPGLGGNGNFLADQLLITGLDEWEDLTLVDTVSDWSQDMVVPTGSAVIPDQGTTTGSGNPFVAFTWAIQKGVKVGFNLVSFDLSTSACNVILNWETNLSEPGSYVEIQRSLDHSYWKTLASVSVDETNNLESYSWIDRNVPKDQQFFYRLRFKNIDDEVSFSDEKTAQVQCSVSQAWELYPNPVSNGFTLIGEAIASNVDILITDIYGRVVKRKNFPVSSNIVYAQMDISGIASGTYNITVINSTNGEVLQSQLLSKD